TAKPRTPIDVSTVLQRGQDNAQISVGVIRYYCLLNYRDRRLSTSKLHWIVTPQGPRRIHIETNGASHVVRGAVGPPRHRKRHAARSRVLVPGSIRGTYCQLEN